MNWGEFKSVVARFGKKKEMSKLILGESVVTELIISFLNKRAVRPYIAQLSLWDNLQ